jgi:hypothetical protein
MIVIKTSETNIYTAYYKDKVIKEIRGVFSYEEAMQIMHDMHPEAEILQLESTHESVQYIECRMK